MLLIIFDSHFDFIVMNDVNFSFDHFNKAPISFLYSLFDSHFNDILQN